MAEHTHNITNHPQPSRPHYATRPATSGIFGDLRAARRLSPSVEAKNHAAQRRSAQNGSVGAEFFHRLRQREFDEYAALETRRV